jgi:hypothetical protein
MLGSTRLLSSVKAPEFRQVLHQVRPDQVVIDLVRILKDIDYPDGQYEGIC